MARKLRGFERILDAPALFAVAYGEIASSLYVALGIVAAAALGLTPLVLLLTGALFLLVSFSYAEGTAAIAEVGGAAREFRRAAGSVAAATDRVGQQATATLDDTRALIADLRSATTEAQRSVAQVGSAVAALQADANRAVVRLDAGVAHFDEQLLVAISDLRTSLETMQRSLDRLGDPRAALLGPDPSRLGPGERLQ
jgi:hypothetical protein